MAQRERIRGRASVRRPSAGHAAPPSGAGAGVPDQLDLRAKTAIPPVRAGTVPRPGLVNRLRAAHGHRLVTLVAPAGYGKTTLLAQWAERDARRFAWVALDGGDDASTLFECVTAALSRSDPIADDEAHRPDRRSQASGAARLSSAEIPGRPSTRASGSARSTETPASGPNRMRSSPTRQTGSRSRTTGCPAIRRRGPGTSRVTDPQEGAPGRPRR